MRDTGCSTVVVRRDLVQPDQFTGSKEACVLIDGVVKYYPTAVIELQTPFFTGTTKAMCMENPIHYLIIGNIQGARMPEERDFISDSNTNSVKPDDVFAAVQSDATTETHQTEVRHQPTTAETPNQNEQKEPKVSLPTSDDTHVPDNTVSIITEALPCAAVQTRGMTKKAEMPPKPLKVADITVDNVSADDMRRLQKDDETLKKYWDLAESNTQPPGEV